MKGRCDEEIEKRSTRRKPMATCDKLMCREMRDEPSEAPDPAGDKGFITELTRPPLYHYMGGKNLHHLDLKKQSSYLVFFFPSSSLTSSLLTRLTSQSSSR